jgi:pimeloyl-ACP methyl ester carboxylesterase
MKLNLNLIFSMALFLTLSGSVFTPVQASASELDANPCTGPNVDSSLQRPFYLNQNPGGTFQYKFEFRRPKDSSQPVVIYLPGGPGEGSIGKQAEMAHVPAEFGLILTDPRGVGCNQVQGPIQDSFYGTRVFASDVIAVIQKLGLKNYILYGHSYGTVLATETAALIEQAHLPAPKAVMLEGVLGKALLNMQEYVAPKLLVWKKIRNQLPPPYGAALSVQNPLGYSPEVWGLFLSGMIAEAGDRIVLPLLAGLNPANTQERAQLIQMLERMKGISFDNPPMERLWKNVACKELMESSPGFALDFFLQQGELVPFNRDVCGESRLTKELAYDAANFQVKAPLFYFVGDLDIATTEDQAVYHYMSQKNPAKYMFKVQRAGHKPLSFNLQDCSQNIFRAIASGDQSNLRKSLSTCSNPIGFR